MTAAQTDFRMTCRNGSSIDVFTVNELSECRGGTVSFSYETTPGFPETRRFAGSVDVAAGEARFDPAASYQEFEKACTSSLICSIAAGIVTSYLLSKLRALHNFLRATLG